MPIWCLQAKARSGCTRFPSRRTPWLKQELIKISGRRAWHSKTFASESVRKFGAMIYIDIYIYILFGGFKHEFYFPFHIWDVILPLTNSYFSRWLKPPTIYIYNHINYNMFSIYIYISLSNPPDNNLHKAWSPGSKVGISWWCFFVGVVESDSSAFDWTNWSCYYHLVMTNIAMENPL